MTPTCPCSSSPTTTPTAHRERGHIALVPVERTHNGRDTVAFVDEGPTLAFSKAMSGIDGAMTPATVRALAAELIAWADRKEGT